MTNVVADSTIDLEIEEFDSNSAISEGALLRQASLVMANKASSSQPLGTIISSILTEVQFQGSFGNNWVLLDGRSTVGDDIDTEFSITVLPDARGRYGRMKDNGAGVNPDGDLALGALQGEAFKSHVHDYGRLTGSGSGSLTTFDWETISNNASSTADGDVAVGGNETRPVSYTENKFIKINNNPI